MLMRCRLVVVLGALAALGASYPTRNFVVEAPTPQIAQQIGEAAERYRRERALDWLGREMPPWPEPCPLRVKVTMSGAGGATSFAFDRGRVLGQHMNIEGPLDRLLASVLPHEVTHTVFAHHYKQPVPRWADEGGSVLSEDEVERNRHDMLCRQILNSPGRAIPLRRLFALREYPSDVMALYAQGFSVSNYLVSLSNKATFLNFVAYGMHPQYGWDVAAQTFYRFRTVEELEQAWLTHLRNTKRPPAQLARATAPAPADLTNRVVVRQTVPPAQPVLEAPLPVFRGQTGATGQEAERFGDGPAADRLTHPAAAVPSGWARDGWRPAEPPAVRLGPPEFGPPPPAAPVGPPPTSSPVGFPF